MQPGKARRPVHLYTSTQSRQTCKGKLRDITEDQKICCQKECLKITFKRSRYQKDKGKFFKRGLKKQGKWLTNFFKISQSENQKLTFDFFVKHKKVCQTAWLLSHGISNGRNCSTVKPQIDKLPLMC